MQRCAAHYHMRPCAIQPMHVCKRHTDDAQQSFASTHAKTRSRPSSVAAKGHAQVSAERACTANGNGNPYSMPTRVYTCSPRERASMLPLSTSQPRTRTAPCQGRLFKHLTRRRQTGKLQAVWTASRTQILWQVVTRCPSRLAPQRAPRSIKLTHKLLLNKRGCYG